MMLGGVSYSQDQLLQILAQPTGVNGLVDLAQAEITATLNASAIQNDESIGHLLYPQRDDADLLMLRLVPPPIGTDSLPEETVAPYVTFLNNFSAGVFGPGLCEADAGAASGANNCTESASYWLNNPGSWPVTSLALGTTRLSQDQLLQILAQPAGVNGFIDLAQAEIAVKLSRAAGADGSSIMGVVYSTDAYIGPSLPPPIGTDSVPVTATAGLVTALNDFLTGVVGPGVCGADAGTQPSENITQSPTQDPECMVGAPGVLYSATWSGIADGTLDLGNGETITILNSDGVHFDWSSTTPISVVIVRGDPIRGVVESYDPAATHAERLSPPNNPDDRDMQLPIYSIKFCFRDASGTTDAGTDTGTDAGTNTGTDAGVDSGGNVQQDAAPLPSYTW